jgi:pimeloyl-ACP methyl ester carboxylesterase
MRTAYSTMSTARSIVTLARWLGPWADARQAPDVAIVDDRVDAASSANDGRASSANDARVTSANDARATSTNDARATTATEPRSTTAIRVRLYRPHGMKPGEERAAYLLAHGLHFQGPDDVRMDRFCRILAAAGHLVIAPFIPSYLALLPRRAAIEEFERVFDARTRWTKKKPVVFSISFGSLLAFALAAKRGSELDGLVVFGGYADFHETMTFCLTGKVASGRAAKRDPLNQPVVLMNLLAELRPECADPVAVSSAWRAYVERTWGRPEMKARERFSAIADEIAPSVPETVRDLFHVGIGTRPGAEALATDALTRFAGEQLDPMPFLSRVNGRVDLVHGIDDDVIPFEHSHDLAKHLVSADARVHITGLYGHTGAQRPKLSALAEELATMIRVLRVFAR